MHTYRRESIFTAPLAAQKNNCTGNELQTTVHPIYSGPHNAALSTRHCMPMYLQLIALNDIVAKLERGRMSHIQHDNTE